MDGQARIWMIRRGYEIPVKKRKGQARIWRERQGYGWSGHYMEG